MKPQFVRISPTARIMLEQHRLRLKTTEWADSQGKQLGKVTFNDTIIDLLILAGYSPPESQAERDAAFGRSTEAPPQPMPAR